MAVGRRCMSTYDCEFRSELSPCGRRRYAIVKPLPHSDKVIGQCDFVLLLVLRACIAERGAVWPAPDIVGAARSVEVG